MLSRLVTVAIIAVVLVIVIDSLPGRRTAGPR